MSDNEQQSLLLIGLERVTHLICRCYVHESLYLQVDPSATSIASQANNNLRTALLRLYSKLLIFVAGALRTYSRNTLHRILGSWLNAGTLQTQLNELTELEDAATREAMNSGFQLVTDGQKKLQQYLSDPILRIDDSTKAISTEMDTQRRERILKWLSPLPYQKYHNAAAEGRTAGIGEWLFANDKYPEWRQLGSSCFLWLCGSRRYLLITIQNLRANAAIAGMGKTKLVSKLVDDLAELKNNASVPEALLYFYCDRSDSARRDPTTIFQSLVRQLSFRLANSTLPSSVVDLYEIKRREGFASDQLTIEESVNLFRSLSVLLTELTIVIDALDECYLSSRLQIVEILSNEIARSTSRLKIFISSRPDRDIKHRFAAELKLEINVSQNFSDIVTYIHWRVHEKKPLSWGDQVDRNLEEHICQKLIDQCQGM